MDKNNAGRIKKRDKSINLVFDSSPLIYLAKIRILGKLSKLSGDRYVPQSVYREVMKGKEQGREDAFLIDDLITNRVFKVAEVTDKKFLNNLLEIPSLDYADAETLSLAKEMKGIAIVDDSRARTIAEMEGVEFRGSIFILFSLFRKKAINKNQVKEYLDEMIRLGWRCSTELYAAILDEIKNL